MTNINIMYRQYIGSLFVFTACLALFTVGLSHQEVIGFDSRFYLFALEMWRQGWQWFPTTYHQPYPDYPGTATSVIYFFACLFGTFNKLIAVLPSAVAGAISAAMTYLIGEKQHKRLGLYAVFFMLMTFTFFKSARAISLDMYSTMATVCCFYLLMHGQSCKRYWLYLFLGIGFLFRGPIGLVIPAGVVCSYYLIDKQWKLLFTFGGFALLLLICLSAALMLIAYHVGGYTFVQQVWHMQVLGRLDNYYLPRYFYFTNSLSSYAFSLPLALLVIIGVVFARLTGWRDHQNSRFLMQLAGWIFIILIGMSVPDDKKIRYILAMTPAAALLAASLFVLPQKQIYFKILRWVALRIIFFLPLLLFIFVMVAHYFLLKKTWPLQIHTILISEFLLLLQFINIFYLYQKTPTIILLTATLSFVMCYLSVAEPIELYIERARDFVTRIEMMRIKQHARLVFYKERPDGLPIKYLINNSEQTLPEFIDTPNKLLNYQKPVFFVTSADYFNQLPKAIMSHLKIIDSDMLGHTKVMVFTIQVK